MSETAPAVRNRIEQDEERRGTDGVESWGEMHFGSYVALKHLPLVVS